MEKADAAALSDVPARDKDLVKAGRQFEIVAENELGEGPFSAGWSPWKIAFLTAIPTTTAVFIPTPGCPTKCFTCCRSAALTP